MAVDVDGNIFGALVPGRRLQKYLRLPASDEGPRVDSGIIEIAEKNGAKRV